MRLLVTGGAGFIGSNLIRHISKIKNEIGWKPAHDFQNGIRETVRWYLENQIWAEKVLGRRAN